MLLVQDQGLIQFPDSFMKLAVSKELLPRGKMLTHGLRIACRERIPVFGKVKNQRENHGN